MTAGSPALTANRIVGLFPELLGVGGVQEAGRQTAAAISEIAQDVNWDTAFLSLNDAQGLQSFSGGGREISFSGSARSKAKFITSALGQSSKGTKIVLAAHPNLALPVALMKCKSPRIETILISHGIEVWKRLPMLRRRALLAAELVLAPSRDTIQKLIDVQGVAPEKTRRLAWPVDSSFLDWAENPAKLSLPAGFPVGPIVLTVGRWATTERYKGADELIQAVSRLQEAQPELNLVAVGDGDDLPRLRQLAHDCGVDGRVHFFSRVSRRELAACFAHADIFALPSTGEGFGMVFLEAMVFGRPIVGAACGGTTDVLEDGVNGLLVPPHDAGRLEQALLRLMRDEKLRAELGLGGARIVRQKYSFEVFRSELKQILAECGLASNLRS